MNIAAYLVQGAVIAGVGWFMWQAAAHGVMGLLAALAILWLMFADDLAEK